MQTNTFGSSYSGIGPNNFNKRQLFEIIQLRQKAGAKAPKKELSLKQLDETPRTRLVTEAKRMRQDKTWSELYNTKRVSKHATTKYITSEDFMG